MYESPNTDSDSERLLIRESLLECDKTGLHNPFKNP